MLRFFSRVVAPLLSAERCIGCGAFPLPRPLCPQCEAGLYAYIPLSAPRCGVCGKPLLSEQGLCMGCRSAPVLSSTDGVWPLHTYRLWHKTLLHVWKAERARALSPVFASLVCKALSELEQRLGERLPVVPVPPRPGKLRRTGWDQIADLCLFLRRRKMQVLPYLRRISTVQQKKLGRKERLEKTSYVFDPPGKLAGKPLPPAVVLVDDMLTSGATIQSCARALKNAGVGRVYAVTLFCAD